jgi:preprotein translocase subunit SecD
VVRGTDIRDASAAQGEMNRWETNFVLTQEAAKRFGAIPKPTSAIARPSWWMAGDQRAHHSEQDQRHRPHYRRATQEEAADLALNLRAGSLPAALCMEEERTVGPRSAPIPFGKVLRGHRGLGGGGGWMLVYYRRSGINATLALVLNAVILIAALSYFDATLDLARHRGHHS